MNDLVLRELSNSFGRPDLSDSWSDLTASIYFDAALFHGLELTHANVPDIYSYALEAAEALKYLPPLLSPDERLAAACRDWHREKMTNRVFLARVTTLCRQEEHAF